MMSSLMYLQVKKVIMGNKIDAFSEEQLEEYQVRNICSHCVHVSHSAEYFEHTAGTSILTKLTHSPRQENPFRRRVCEVFSGDRSARLTFDQFLEMFSVFSEHAPRDIKAVYAFRVYGKSSMNFTSKQSVQLFSSCRLLSFQLIS
nr:calcium and integrin-binding family member 2-like [Cherax quadricarinatus]